MTNKEKIIQLIKENKQMSVDGLSDSLGISLSMVHRHIKQMLDDEILQKIGSAPHVFYALSQKKIKKEIKISGEVEKKINQNFFLISPRGERLEGVEAFIYWCEKRDFEVVKKAKEYEKIFDKYEKLKKHGVISGKAKMIKTFGKQICIEDVFYVDFYVLEIFGKTKLGQLLLYSKQSQNKKMIKDVVQRIKPTLSSLIKLKKIDAIGFIPPTVKRQVQFMKVMQKELNLSLPEVEIIKIKTEIITPQKTLNKLHDRIENANHTIFVKRNNNKYKKILLIDDAVGSGATLNQVACKIRENKTVEKVYGFALTGSVKGFDVISEV